MEKGKGETGSGEQGKEKQKDFLKKKVQIKLCPEGRAKVRRHFSKLFMASCLLFIHSMHHGLS